MTAPAVAAARFCMAGAVGAGLGLFYGFLRPLRRKSCWLPDLIFVIAAFVGWVYVGFGICKGDLRLAYYFGMALGGIGWEMTAGKLLRPVFSFFWKGIGWILGLFLLPCKKIFAFSTKIAKKVLAKCRKWFTIGWNICRHRRKPGGEQHGQSKKKTLPPGAGPHKAGGEAADPAGGGALHRGAGGAAGKHRRRKKPV